MTKHSGGASGKHIRRSRNRRPASINSPVRRVLCPSVTTNIATSPSAFQHGVPISRKHPAEEAPQRLVRGGDRAEPGADRRIVQPKPRPQPALPVGVAAAGGDGAGRGRLDRCLIGAAPPSARIELYIL